MKFFKDQAEILHDIDILLAISTSPEMFMSMVRACLAIAKHESVYTDDKRSRHWVSEYEISGQLRMLAKEFGREDPSTPTFSSPFASIYQGLSRNRDDLVRAQSEVARLHKELAVMTTRHAHATKIAQTLLRRRIDEGLEKDPCGHKLDEEE